MKKNLATTMIMAAAAMMEASTTAQGQQMQITNTNNGWGATNFVSGQFGFRIPMNIPNQRQRRILARRRNHRK
jgi:hypothetical protein